jgi:hypothetical protein
MWKFPDGVRSGAAYGHRVEAMGDGHKNRTGNNRAVPCQPTGASGENDGRQLRCHICRDVIGIYEPMITLLDGRPYETSQAVEPDGAARASECYHQACYLRERSLSTSSKR